MRPRQMKWHLLPAKLQALETQLENTITQKMELQQKCSEYSTAIARFSYVVLKCALIVSSGNRVIALVQQA